MNTSWTITDRRRSSMLFSFWMDA